MSSLVLITIVFFCFSGLNLSSKTSSSPQHPTDLSQREASPASTINDEDAPLNLSLKTSTNPNENGKYYVNYCM